MENSNFDFSAFDTMETVSLDQGVKADVLSLKERIAFYEYPSGDNAKFSALRIDKSKAGNNTLYFDFIHTEDDRLKLLLTINQENMSRFYSSMQKLRYLIKHSHLSDEQATALQAKCEAIRNASISVYPRETAFTFEPTLDADNKLIDVDYADVVALKKQLNEAGRSFIEYTEDYQQVVNGETLTARAGRVVIQLGNFTGNTDLETIQAMFTPLLNNTYSMETKVSESNGNKYNDITFINPMID